MLKTLVLKHPYWPAALALILGAVVYWSFIATDRYVSQSTVVLKTAQIAAPEFNISSLLSGSGGLEDMLLLREHLLSVDMMQKLDRTFDLRSHYTSRDIDPLSRLDDPQVPLETFHHYMRKRIQVHVDEYAQVLRIEAAAYDPELAHQLVRTLMKEGERHMNAMSRRLAQEQVKFIELQVEDIQGRLERTRDELLAFQNEHGLVSPTGTIETLSTVVATLEGELAKLKARQRALKQTQSERSAEMVQLRNEIEAIQEQIETEQRRMAAQEGNALNQLTAEYETLEMQLEFAREMYSSALATLENTRVEAARNIQQVSVLQEPTRPQYPNEPDRLYNLTVFTLLTLLGALIVHMFAAIIREHRD
ncbi:MAG: chain-length determining protein [Ectothiorhodospira sp.]